MCVTVFAFFTYLLTYCLTKSWYKEATEAPWLWPPSAAPAGAAGGRGNAPSGPLAEVLAPLQSA